MLFRDEIIKSPDEFDEATAKQFVADWGALTALRWAQSHGKAQKASEQDEQVIYEARLTRVIITFLGALILLIIFGRH